MAIVTATRVAAAAQIDGRLAVHEVHQSDVGAREDRYYLAPADANLDVMLAQNSAAFLERLAKGGT